MSAASTTGRWDWGKFDRIPLGRVSGRTKKFYWNLNREVAGLHFHEVLRQDEEVQLQRAAPKACMYVLHSYPRDWMGFSWGLCEILSHLKYSTIILWTRHKCWVKIRINNFFSLRRSPLLFLLIIIDKISYDWMTSFCSKKRYLFIWNCLIRFLIISCAFKRILLRKTSRWMDVWMEVCIIRKWSVTLINS